MDGAGARQIPLVFDTGTKKVIMGDGNDYEPFGLPTFTGADAGMVVAVSDPVTGGIRESAGGRSIIRPVALAQSFRAAKDNNPRTNSTATTSVVAFGGTPTGGTLGYATTGVVTTGWQSWVTKSSTNSVLPFIASAGKPEFSTNYVQGTSYYNSSGVRRQSAAMELSVVTNAPEPVINLLGYSSQYKIKIDGKRCGNVVTPSSGGLFDVSINLRGFGAGFHTITLILNQDDSVAGFKIPKAYQAFPPVQKPLIAMFADSLGNSAPDVGGQDCLAAIIGDYLGAEVWLFGAGQSGYETVGSSETFLDRIDIAVATLSRDPDLVLFAGGINDAGSGGFQAAVSATIEKAKSRWLAPVGVFGSWASRDLSNQATKTAQEQLIAAAATSAGAKFIPVMTDPRGAWITGTGAVNSPTGDGTADTLFNTADSTHWAGIGHAIIGQRAAYAIAEAFGL